MDNSNYVKEQDVTTVSDAPSSLLESAFTCQQSNVPISTIRSGSPPVPDIPKRPSLKHTQSLKSSLSLRKDVVSIVSGNPSSSGSENSDSAQEHQPPVEQGFHSLTNQKRRSSSQVARRQSQIKRRPSQLSTLPNHLELDLDSQLPMTPNKTVYRSVSQIPISHSKSEPSSDVKAASPYPLEQKQGDEATQGSEKNENLWGRRKISVHNMMDFSLMIANIAQLRALLTSEGNQYKTFILICIALSMIFQIIFACCMIRRQILNEEISKSATNERKGRNKKFRRKRICKKFLDEIGNYLVLFILVSNGLITGFGFL